MLDRMGESCGAWPGLGALVEPADCKGGLGQYPDHGSADVACAIDPERCFLGTEQFRVFERAAVAREPVPRGRSLVRCSAEADRMPCCVRLVHRMLLICLDWLYCSFK